ncbi:insulinase family protein, partial [bacterium]|nr:insulinase family protein [bacterium]
MNKTFKTKQYKNLNFQLLALPDTNYFKIEVVNKLGADAERTYLKKTGENIFGLSHLVEHLSFKTSKDYSTEELLKLLKSEGIFNASTDFDRINYFFETSMDKLNLGTKLIFNCALNTLLKVSQEDFETEKLVVTNEIKRYFDDDQTMFHLSIPSSLLDLDKNDNILGSPETIKEVTLKQSQSLKSFFLNEGENFFNITYDPTILTELEVLEAVYSEYIKFEKQPSAEYPITAIEVKEDLKQPIKNNRIKLDSEAEQSLTYFNFDIFK